MKNDLLVKAQRGDRDAQGEIVERQMSMILYEARRLASRQADIDDMVQEGSIAVLKAIERFNPQRGNFAAFARKCVRNAMIDLYAVERRRREENGLDAETVVARQAEEMPPALAEWLNGLGRTERQFVYLALGIQDDIQRTPQELAAIYDRAPWYIYKKLQAIKDDARKVMQA